MNEADLRQEREAFRLHAELCRTLTDPKRLMIIRALREHGERSVGELAGALGMSLPNTSQHLAVLRYAGFVAGRRVGTTVNYSLVEPRIAEACEIVHRIVLDRVRAAGAIRGIRPRGSPRCDDGCVVVMICCVPVQLDGSIDPRWGRARTIAIARTEGGAIAAWTELEVQWDRLKDTAGEGAHHARVARLLRENGVDTVLAHHMGYDMLHMLQKMGMTVVLGAAGQARRVVEAAAQDAEPRGARGTG